MTDLHTHLLPGIDDGAKTPGDASALLKQQKSAGVRRVFLTPHFYCERTELGEFLARREESFTRLLDFYDPLAMPEVKLGAEVRYSTALLDLDLSGLTLGGGNCLLLELPGQHFPAHLDQVLQNLGMMGITPILAHIERYRYFREEPELLFKLIGEGALGQINAESLVDRATRSFATACLKHSLAQFVASDAHDLALRPPNLDKLPDLLEPEVLGRCESFARAVFDQTELPFVQPSPVKKRLLGYV